MSEGELHIHLDLVGGLAGDMFVAAAIDAGLVQPDELEQILGQIGIGEIELHVERVQRGAIEGTHISFSGWAPEEESDHRHLSTIRTMLAGSDLPQAVRARAVEMFERLGAAEAEVHGMELDDVHFHEVGAVDSILDFVAAAWIIETAGASWSVGVIPAGSGTIDTAHGTIPVPAPATSKVLEGFDIEYRDVDAELVTPTGATIAATVAALEGQQQQGTLRSSGFGCGSRELQDVSNVVRLSVLETTDEPAQRPQGVDGVQRETILRLVTEIDDLSPELLAYAAERLMEAGALDVVREPVQMKKGRIGERLAVLCRPEHEARLVQVLFDETTTLGIRRIPEQRWVLARETKTVSTPLGDVVVKIARRSGEVVNVSPEFESCARVADNAEVPIREVYVAAMEAARR